VIDSGFYEICVAGFLDQRWSDWFDGLQISTRPGGMTVIYGHVADQGALHGLLTRVRDLNLPLISVNLVDPG
jgi:hypothetical protein